MKIKDIINKAKELEKIKNYELKRKERLSFLDSNFPEVYRWTLADRIIHEFLQFGCNRDLNQEI